MAKLLKLRRGTTTQHGSFTGAEGEVTIDTTKDTAVIHDGSTQGGTPLAKEDMSNVSSASIAGRLSADSIATTKIAGGVLPTDVTVASANLVDGTIVNADIAANAAIEGTKLENSGVTAGSYGSSAAIPSITVDAQGLVTAASTTNLTSISNGSGAIGVSFNGPITSGVHHDFSSSVNVTGGLTANGNLTISHDRPAITFTDTNSNPDFEIANNHGQLVITDTTNSVGRLVIQSDGTCDIQGNLDANGGLDVTGDITVSGTVDGVDIATRDTLFGGVTANAGIIKNTVSLADGVTATTQSAGDNSTKVATTAYTDTAITNLVDSSPAALNTLNELAAALGDDANFSTTVTSSLATKMPLAGGTFTGAVTGTTFYDSKGDLRKIPLRNTTSAYTLQASDLGKAVYISTGGVTVNPSVFAAADAVTIINNSGSDQTITQGSSMTLYNTGDATTGNRTLAGRGMATIWFADHNIAYISGSGLS